MLIEKRNLPDRNRRYTSSRLIKQKIKITYNSCRGFHKNGQAELSKSGHYRTLAANFS